MPIDANQWRTSVGLLNASRMPRSLVAMKGTRHLRKRPTRPKSRGDRVLTAVLSACVVLLQTFWSVVANQWRASVGLLRASRMPQSLVATKGSKYQHLCQSNKDAPFLNVILLLSAVLQLVLTVVTSGGRYYLRKVVNLSDLNQWKTQVQHLVSSLKAKWVSLLQRMGPGRAIKQKTAVTARYVTNHLWTVAELLNQWDTQAGFMYSSWMARVHYTQRCPNGTKCLSLLLTCLMVVQMLLIMAGDVELNPGPLTRQDTVLSENNLGDVYEELFDVSKKWYDIGLQLNLRPGVLDAIEASHYYDSVNTCLRKMLHQWLKTTIPPPTWEVLASALERRTVGELQLALQLREKYCQAIPIAPAQSEPSLAIPGHQDKSLMPSQLDAYAKYLQNVYKRWPPPPTTWPPVCRAGYINLAIEDKGFMSRQLARDDRFKAIQLGRVDKILQTSSAVHIEDILKPEEGTHLECVLLEGAPGVGKSTFVWELCRQWAEGKILQEYKLVILLRLQDKRVQTGKHLADMFPYSDDQEEKKVVFKEICDKQGANTLIILDSLDEIPDFLSKSPVLRDFIQGFTLPKATRLVTTRPSGSWNIASYLNQGHFRHLEILGFLPHNVDEYCEQVLEGEMLEEFQLYLSVNPHIKGMMYIPLNCVIVTEVYRYTRSTPQTITELYTSLCRTFIRRYLTGNNLHQYSLFTSFTELPAEVLDDFKNVCCIAFKSVKHQRPFYSPPSNQSSFNHLGFMHSFTELYILNPCITYCFLHHTIQEYLAAYHISTLTKMEQMELFRAHYRDCQFENVWRFFAGLTKFSGIEGGWETVKQICFVHGDVEVEVDEVIDTDFEFERSSSLIHITLYGLHWLYETQDLKTLSILDSSTTMFRYISNLTPFDCLALGYCIANSNCEWELTLSGSQIQDPEIAMLVRALKMPSSLQSGGIQKLDLCIGRNAVLLLKSLPWEYLQRISELILSKNGLNREAALELATPLQAMDNLTILNLTYNPFGNGGAVELIRSLLVNRIDRLKELHLRETEIGLKDIEAIHSFLVQDWISLQLLDVSENDLMPDSLAMLSEALCRNYTLKSLNLSFSNFDSKSMDMFASMLDEGNLTLEVVYLWNCGIDDNSMSILAKALCENTGVQELHLTGNPLGLMAAISLSDLLKENQSLQILTVCENTIGMGGAEVLIDSLKDNKTLMQLSLPQEYQNHGESLDSYDTNVHRVKWSRYD